MNDLCDSAGEFARVGEPGCVAEVLERVDGGEVDPFGSPTGMSSFDWYLNKISVNFLQKCLWSCAILDCYVVV